MLYLQRAKQLVILRWRLRVKLSLKEKLTCALTNNHLDQNKSTRHETHYVACDVLGDPMSFDELGKISAEGRTVTALKDTRN